MNVKKISKFILLLTFASSIFFPGYVSAQKGKNVVFNLPKYDTHWLHFGFILAVNSTNFIIKPVANFYLFDTLKSVESVAKPGFNLGIVADVMFTEYIGVRFIPDIAFSERNLLYGFMKDETSYIVTKKVESTFLDFPLDFKIKSQRMGNYGVYLVAGLKYAIDLISQKDVNNTAPGMEVVKIRRDDICYEAGAGLDFYLPYFKFAIEAKLSVGTKELLIKDASIYSNSIDGLNSKVFLISFTFEGS